MSRRRSSQRLKRKAETDQEDEEDEEDETEEEITINVSIIYTITNNLQFNYNILTQSLYT